MQFRDLKKQYESLKPQMDAAVSEVLTEANYISGRQVAELEKKLALHHMRKRNRRPFSGADGVGHRGRRCGVCTGFYFLCFCRDGGL